MTALAAPLPPDPARPGVAAPPDRHGGTGRPSGHRLGTPAAVVARVVSAVRGAAGERSAGAVALAVLGEAVAAPTGGPFRDDDGGDRVLLVRLLRALGQRLTLAGCRLGDPGDRPAVGAVVPFELGDVHPAPPYLHGWSHVATDVELRRWAARACPPPSRATAAALSSILVRPTANWAQVEAIRAEYEEWPPPIVVPSGARPVRSAPVELVRPPGALVVLDNVCERGRGGTPCAPWRVGSPGIRCSRCGTVTPVLTTRVGPRLVACECGVEAVCVHPVRVPAGRPR